MFLLYNDESGDQAQDKFFVVTSILLKSNTWHSNLKAIKEYREKFIQKYQIELKEWHAVDMIQAHKEFSERQWRKKLHEDRINIVMECITFAKTLPLSFSSTICKVENKSSHEIKKATWKTVVANYISLLSQHNSLGLVINDSEFETDHMLKTIIQDVDKDGHILEDNIPLKSETSLFIQLCDLYAYLLRRSMEPTSRITAQMIEKCKIKDLHKNDNIHYVQ